MTGKIILVSDLPDSLHELRELITAAGYEIELLNSTQGFGAYIDSHPAPDLSIKAILGELAMKQGNGEALLNLVRNSSYASVPVVLMANLIDQDTVTRLRSQGVDGLLCKPITGEAFKKQLKLATERREAVDLAQIMGGQRFGQG